MSSFGIDNQPLKYYNGKPIYLTLYLTLVLAGGTVAFFLFGTGGLALPFAFSPYSFRSGALWQPFTYIFVDRPNFFSILALIAFYAWGVEVEKYLGRRRFVAICAVLILAPVILLSLYSFIGPVDVLYSSYLLAAGLLVAFATLYPDIDYLGGWIPLKWFAFACIVCGSLAYFGAHRWDQLLVLWGNCFFAFIMVRHGRGLLDFNFKMPRLWPQKKPKFRVLPRPAETRAVHSTAIADERDEAEEELDGLLDKIARSGLGSLSAAEKARLESLRQKLLKKGS